jgi:hypothetical protein
MKTFVEKEQKGLLKKFHTLACKAGMRQEEKDALLESYGVESSCDLTAKDLLDICNKLEMQSNPRLAEMDVWRKRLMAAVGGWLRAMGRESNGQVIKAIACRAAARVSFNEIPLEQLRSLYYAFGKKQKDLRKVEELTDEQIDLLISMN